MSKETGFDLGAARMWRVEPGTLPWASDLGRGAGGAGGGALPADLSPSPFVSTESADLPVFLADTGSDWQPHKRWGVSWEEPVGSNWLVRAKLSGEGGACRGPSPSPETRAIV